MSVLNSPQKPIIPSSLTMKDVAAHAGVSIATVSRVIGNKGGVRPELVQRVRQAIEDLGYRPNQAARRLRERKARIIGVLVTDIQIPFFASIVVGIDRILQEAGYLPLLGNTFYSLASEKAHLNNFLSGPTLVLLAPDRRAYGALCALITTGRRRARKGGYSLSRSDLEPHAESGLLALWIPGETPSLEEASWVRERFPDRSWLAAELHLGPTHAGKLRRLEDLSRRSGLPVVAAGDVHMHLRSRRRLQDALTAIRLRRPVAECGHALYPNGERHLRLRARLAQIYPPELIRETIRIADRCRFSLEELRYAGRPRSRQAMVCS